MLFLVLKDFLLTKLFPYFIFFSRPITRTVKIKIVTGNNPKKVSTEDQDKLGVCEWNELTKRLSSIFSSRFCISMESIKT